VKRISRRARTAGAVLTLSIAAAALVAAPRGLALNGTATYAPAESNISGKYWVSATASNGDATLAIDGKPDTVWQAANAPASLSVDLGGAYDAVHKVDTTFASNRSVYKYRLEGSEDGQAWTTLADRSANTRIGGIFTDVFSFKGLRYVRLSLASGSAVGVRELGVINYLRSDQDNGSDTSEQGGNTTTYYYNPANNPPVPGVRGGKFTDAGSIDNGNNFFGLTKDLGWDTIRLRVWNEPKNETNGAPVNTAGNNSPLNTLRVAKAVRGAGQNLAIDLHYGDSWADPQNQPKPYAWASLPFNDLVTTTYQWTYDFVKSLVAQGTTPTIVALGNETTNGVMWGSEYDKITPYVHHHDYYTSGRYLGAPGGGVEWLKYEEANGDTSSPAYQEFLGSIDNFARLIDAGNRAVKQVNADLGTHIDTELHFAFNVTEQPATGPKISLDPNKVFTKVMTLINQLSTDLKNRGGMVNRIGLSYYPDWHGPYSVVQKNFVEISKTLPELKLNIAETAPKSSGTLTDPLTDPNRPLGFVYTTQTQGDDTMDEMKVINDVPNNVGTGVWPWAGTNVYATGSGANGTLRASFKVFNDAFAKNVVESRVFVATDQGKAPVLPATVKSLDLATGVTSDVPVSWDPVPAASYVNAGTFTVKGIASVTVPAAGRGQAMTAVTATVDVSTFRNGDVGGAVPATLSLSLGAAASFGAFTPGVAADYSAATTANVVSTAGDATLSVADPSSTATGHLVNGAFSLPSPLQARARDAANTGTAYNNVGSSASPLNLLTYGGPISNDAVTLQFSQHIGASDALRTGSYAKTLTFTLSTTTP
jgi:arabinogalactan endo-1,4-beta-galactosidase